VPFRFVQRKGFLPSIQFDRDPLDAGVRFKSPEILSKSCRDFKPTLKYCFAGIKGTLNAFVVSLFCQQVAYFVNL